MADDRTIEGERMMERVFEYGMTLMDNIQVN